MLRKRKRIVKEDAKRMLALQAESFLGPGDADPLSRSSTYEIESIGGRMRDYISAAKASNDERPVFGVCDELNSFLIFNKLYRQEITIPVKKTKKREQIYLISAFFPDQRRERFQSDKFQYEPMYGGVTDCGPRPGGTDDSDRLFAPRPAAMCKLTHDLMFTAGSDFGWRALLYRNKGPDDPFPTGIVALEGWLFKLVDVERPDPKGKMRVVKESVDQDDLHEYARRIQGIINRANAVVEARMAGDSGEDLGKSTLFAPEIASGTVDGGDDDVTMSDVCNS